MKIQQIAKLIRLPDEKWERTMERARNIKKYGTKYDPHNWNSDEHMQNAHNCYTYFLNKRKKSLTRACKRENCQKKNRLKPQPGYHAGFPKNKKHTCRNITRRMLKDNPHMYRTTMKKDCKPHYHMGALVAMPGSTYHYYRRDNTGYWSHKDGAGVANQKDADGNYILDPKKANRRYPNRIKDGQVVDYSDFCGYFCVPNDKKKVFWKSRPYPAGHKRSRIKRKKKKKKKTRKKEGGLPLIPLQPVIPQMGGRKTRRKHKKRSRRTRKKKGGGFLQKIKNMFSRGKTTSTQSNAAFSAVRRRRPPKPPGDTCELCEAQMGVGSKECHMCGFDTGSEVSRIDQPTQRENKLLSEVPMNRERRVQMGMQRDAARKRSAARQRRAEARSIEDEDEATNQINLLDKFGNWNWESPKKKEKREEGWRKREELKRIQMHEPTQRGDETSGKLKNIPEGGVFSLNMD